MTVTANEPSVSTTIIESTSVGRRSFIKKYSNMGEEYGTALLFRATKYAIAASL